MSRNQSGPGARRAAIGRMDRGGRSERLGPEPQGGYRTGPMTMYSESLRAFLKPVLPYLDDESVSEILINGPADVWVEREGEARPGWTPSSARRACWAPRGTWPSSSAARSPTSAPGWTPACRTAAASTWCCRPVAKKGTSISIRKFFRDKPTIDALLGYGSVTPPMARLLEAGDHHQAQHDGRRRHGQREDDPAQHPLLADPRRRADPRPSRTRPSCSCTSRTW